MARRMVFDGGGEVVDPLALHQRIYLTSLTRPSGWPACRVVFDDEGEAVDPLALLAREEEFGEEEAPAAAAGG